MSQHPYGYGFHGQQPAAQQYMSFQPYGAYSAPGYSTQPPQQPPLVPADYYNVTKPAYEYNTNIPGLGTPSTKTPFPVPYNASWEQGPYVTTAPHPPPTPYSTCNAPNLAALPSTSVASTNFKPKMPASEQRDRQLRQKQERTRPQDNTPTKNQANTAIKQPLEQIGSEDEAEISDGQFDDLYEDVYEQPPGLPNPKAASPKPSEDKSAKGSDQEPNFYDTEIEEASGPSKVKGDLPKGIESQRTEHDRSRSYSPYLSPKEIEQDNPRTKTPAIDTGEQLSVANSNAVSSANDLLHSPEQRNGAGQGESQGGVHLGYTASSTKSTARGLAEAQNEAKKAILRLLPHGVKYQTYLDEGFDEKVVKDLFIQLNLAPSGPSSTPPVEKPAAIRGRDSQVSKQEPAPASRTDVMTKKQEERKDKIARLLAEKKARAAAAELTTASKSPKTATSAGVSTASMKPKTQAEKNLLLQQKMEALRRARDLKVKVADERPPPSPVPVPKVIEKETSNVSTHAQQATAQTSTVAKQTSGADAPSGAPQIFQSTTKPNPSPAIPGLPTQQLNQRKRPSAADFVDYPTQAIKRPLLPSQQISSLVISVSDDDDEEEEEEEDDEDVDMEMESAGEDSPVPTQQTFSLPRRGLSVRDFPPLTNTGSPRHLPSPASGTHSGKPGNVDLKSMEKEIAEYKKKIQEAEARAKAKPKNGSTTSQTPSAGHITPTKQTSRPLTRREASTGESDNKINPSIQLLLEAETVKLPKRTALAPAGQQSKAERRARISSVRLTLVTANLEEKITTLRRMEAEIRRLQAEVDEELAEKKRLEEEAVELDSNSADDPDQQSKVTADAAVKSSSESGQSESAYAASDSASQWHPTEMESSSDKSEDKTPRDATGADGSEASFEKVTINYDVSAEYCEIANAAQPTLAHASSGGHILRKPTDAAVNLPADAAADAATDATTDAANAATKFSDDYEPPDAINDENNTTDSLILSPVHAETDSAIGNPNGEVQPKMAMSMPSQISTAAKPHDDPTIEANSEFFAHPSSRATEVSREERQGSVPTSHNSFANYESPLRYFSSFRFHPNYSESVAGGLKSLTYSNRINHNAEICPDDLDGRDCPRGSDCPFQHFSTMTAPDDKIILELGSSDGLMGEQKKNFNNGLRDLVASFQKSKIRDFRTIAEGIVDFRRRFLGDPSRILRLEGVSI